MLEFASSRPLTMGVELELQIVNRRDYNLTSASSDLMALIDRDRHGYDIKPEITKGMIEIATAVHTRHDDMLEELKAIRKLVVTAADRLNLGLCGGGAHPFQKWKEQRIFPTERYHLVSDLYGYLAKQFTVYGQHIHIGCADGDIAIRLLHAMARYIPHFIALSASSPFYQGVDTLFQSSRLTSINAFPLSGTMPFLLDWTAFNEYFDKMSGLGIVASMKDFYWDIRPKPEYGTIEIRVCDTPLEIETAVALAAYAQTLAARIIADASLAPHPHTYLAYSYNRFQACRFGLAGLVVNPATSSKSTIKDDILATIETLAGPATDLGTTDILRQLAERVASSRSDAQWLRTAYENSGSLNDVVRQQSNLWTDHAIDRRR